MVLSEQAMRRWKVTGGLATAVVGFMSIFLVEYKRPVSPYECISDGKQGSFTNDKHCFSDLQEWFWDRVDSSLGIPKHVSVEKQRIYDKYQIGDKKR